jgi:hypothetical protein
VSAGLGNWRSRPERVAVVALVIGVAIYLGMGMRTERFGYAEVLASNDSGPASEVIVAAEVAKDGRALVLGAAGPRLYSARFGGGGRAAP